MTTGRQGSISQHALEISGLARASPLFISDQPPSNEIICLKHILIEPVCYHSSSSHAYLCDALHMDNALLLSAT